MNKPAATHRTLGLNTPKHGLQAPLAPRQRLCLRGRQRCLPGPGQDINLNKSTKQTRRLWLAETEYHTKPHSYTHACARAHTHTHTHTTHRPFDWEHLAPGRVPGRGSPQSLGTARVRMRSVRDAQDARRAWGGGRRGAPQYSGTPRGGVGGNSRGAAQESSAYVPAVQNHAFHCHTLGYARGG
jgi:hypothetical protein